MITFKNIQVDREAYIISMCTGKRVLNIGCLAANKKSGLHKKIEEVAATCIGLDIYPSDLPNYVQGDAQDFFFTETFEVIVIGEVIEHLWNLEGCIKSAYQALIANGNLILTTPNAYAPVFIKRAVIGQVVKNDPEHCLLFDVTTLGNLLNNYVKNLYSGHIFFYEESEANSISYRIQKILAFINRGYSRGLVASLVKI